MKARSNGPGATRAASCRPALNEADIEAAIPDQPAGGLKRDVGEVQPRYARAAVGKTDGVCSDVALQMQDVFVTNVPELRLFDRREPAFACPDSVEPVKAR